MKTHIIECKFVIHDNSPLVCQILQLSRFERSDLSISTGDCDFLTQPRLLHHRRFEWKLVLGVANENYAFLKQNMKIEFLALA